ILSTGRGRFNAAMPESELNPVEDWTSIGPKGGCHYGTPDEKRRSQTFRAWMRKLERLGYHVEYRVLAACDYGAPTTRRRLYVIARRDGAPRWPTPTHGPGCAQPWRTAAEIIDWSLPLPSIFDRKKPLAAATLARIARGIKRFVIDEQRPFLIHVSNGERVGQVPRIYDLQRPLGTVVAGGVKQALVACYLARHFGGRGTVGSDLREPLRTVTAQDHHALVGAFFAQHSVDQGALQIVDIGMRLLTPRELARAQGFPDDYEIATGADGARITRTDQVRLIGNSVCPPVARALLESNR
ncbi:MAG: DNA cytosine methyltransferase, partial [Bosea sp. (in: a-proteobacteria)]